MKKDTSCLNCAHNNPDNVFTCRAFPDGIPVEIAAGDVAHFQPIAGDHGFQFKEKDKPEEEKEK